MFVAVYAWRVKPGREEDFRRGWARVTEAIRARWGTFGSRLHRTLDGEFVGYAGWPDEATWRAAIAAGWDIGEPEARALMRDAIESSRPEPVFLMNVDEDLLGP